MIYFFIIKKVEKTVILFKRYIYNNLMTFKIFIKKIHFIKFENYLKSLIIILFKLKKLNYI